MYGMYVRFVWEDIEQKVEEKSEKQLRKCYSMLLTCLCMYVPMYMRTLD